MKVNSKTKQNENFVFSQFQSWKWVLFHFHVFLRFVFNSALLLSFLSSIDFDRFWYRFFEQNSRWWPERFSYGCLSIHTHVCVHEKALKVKPSHSHLLSKTATQRKARGNIRFVHLRVFRLTFGPVFFSFSQENNRKSALRPTWKMVETKLFLLQLNKVLFPAFTRFDIF